MKNVFLILFIFLEVVVLHAQCDCPALPDDMTGKTVVHVRSVNELQFALRDCNTNNGNYTILLTDGIYQLGDDLLYISPNMSNLTIRSASGNRDAVEIRGKGPNGAVQYIFNVAASNFTLADVTIGNVMYHGVQIHGESDADNCLIQNVRFEDINQQFFKVSAGGNSTADNGIVQCCWFEFTDGIGYQYYTGGIDAHASTNWLIRYNTFKHIRSPENFLSEHAIHFWKNSADNIIENNLIIDCDRGIGFGLGTSPTSGGIIRNNFIHTSRDVGIGLESAADPKVYHNTIVTNNYFNSIEYRFSGTTNVHIANNLTTEAIKTRDGGSGLVETNFITNDRSIFVDADNFDYHLAHNPPAEVLDAGTMLADGGIDFDCEDRVTGIGPDLGADETPFIVKTLENNAFEAFRFSPNPSHGYLLVENAMPGKKATILSLSGKEMYVEKIVSNSFEMDISPLHAGFYYLVIQAQNGGSIYRGKFVKR